MNICDLLYHAGDVSAVLNDKMLSGLTLDEAVDQLTDEVIAQTKKESDAGIIHGVIKELNVNG